MSKFMKIHPVGAELFHVDGQIHKQTDICHVLQLCKRD